VALARRLVAFDPLGEGESEESEDRNEVERRCRWESRLASDIVGYLKTLRISGRVRNNGKSATDRGRRWINNEKLRASQLEDEDLQRA